MPDGSNGQRLYDRVVAATPGGEVLATCLQCGTCGGSCPSGPDMDATPRKIFALLMADFEDEVWRYILLPVYAAAYRFENETFQVLVNGQTGAVAGQKPVAWWKVWLAIAGLLSPGVLLALLGLVLLLLGGIGIFALGLAAILFVIGLVISIKIFQQATEAGAA